MEKTKIRSMIVLLILLVVCVNSTNEKVPRSEHEHKQ